MDSIKISFNEVQAAAETIRGCNLQIYDLLQSAAKEMAQLEAFWKSESSETIRQRFMQFSQQFEVQREIIEAYARFLEHTVETYQSLEGAINSNAQAFQ